MRVLIVEKTSFLQKRLDNPLTMWYYLLVGWLIKIKRWMRLSSERDIYDGVWRLALLCQRVGTRIIDHGYFQSRLARLA